MKTNRSARAVWTPVRFARRMMIVLGMLLGYFRIDDLRVLPIPLTIPLGQVLPWLLRPVRARASWGYSSFITRIRKEKVPWLSGQLEEERAQNWFFHVVPA